MKWQLWKNEELLGVLTLDHVDQPFFHCHFEATPEFEKWRPLFVRVLELGEQEDVCEADWKEANRIQDEDLLPGLRLVETLNAVKIDDLLIHIIGEEAWFRY